MTRFVAEMILIVEIVSYLNNYTAKVFTINLFQTLQIFKTKPTT